MKRSLLLLLLLPIPLLLVACTTSSSSSNKPSSDPVPASSSSTLPAETEHDAAPVTNACANLPLATHDGVTVERIEGEVPLFAGGTIRGGRYELVRDAVYGSPTKTSRRGAIVIDEVAKVFTIAIASGADSIQTSRTRFRAARFAEPRHPDGFTPKLLLWPLCGSDNGTTFFEKANEATPPTGITTEVPFVATDTSFTIVLPTPQGPELLKFELSTKSR